jgi:hypothetical protein
MTIHLSAGLPDGPLNQATLDLGREVYENISQWLLA